MINYDETIKSIQALQSHCLKQINLQSTPGKAKNENSTEYVYLIVTSETPPTKTNDYIPRIIRLPHKFGRTRSRQILLITKDPVLNYRDQIEVTDSDTEGLFKAILGFKKFQSRMQSKRYSTSVFNEYDMVMADHRLHHKLQPVLGKKFYQKNKKVPFMIQINTPEKLEEMRVNRKRSRAQGQDQVKESVDTSFIYQQVKSIVRNTSVMLNSSGNTLSVRIGTIDMSPQFLLENAEASLDFLSNPKDKNIGGGVFGSKNRMTNVFVKTNESTSLPVFINEASEKESHANY